MCCSALQYILLVVSSSSYLLCRRSSSSQTTTNDQHTTLIAVYDWTVLRQRKLCQHSPYTSCLPVKPFDALCWLFLSGWGRGAKFSADRYTVKLIFFNFNNYRLQRTQIVLKSTWFLFFFRLTAFRNLVKCICNFLHNPVDNNLCFSLWTCLACSNVEEYSNTTPPMISCSILNFNDIKNNTGWS